MDQFSKVIVTGGCGAIGSEFINRMKKLHPNTTFVNFDVLTYAGKKENIEPDFANYNFVYGDVCDARLVSYVLDTERPDCIIHFAAETHVDNSFGNSWTFTKSNVLGTHTLLECVRAYMSQHPGTFKMFLHMSTDEVYGSVNDDEPACPEKALFSPSNPYSATKAGAEMLCHAYTLSFKIPIIIVRCNNAISKYQHEEKLIPRTITKLLNNQKMTIHGNGSSKRTFVHAYDIADAIDIILEKGTEGQIYNIGTSIERTVLEVVSTILSVLKPGEKLEDWIEFTQDRAFQDYRYSIDSSALRKLGWYDKIDFESAIKEVVRHYKNK